MHTCAASLRSGRARRQLHAAAERGLHHAAPQREPAAVRQDDVRVPVGPAALEPGLLRVAAAESVRRAELDEGVARGAPRGRGLQSVRVQHLAAVAPGRGTEADETEDPLQQPSRECDAGQRDEGQCHERRGSHVSQDIRQHGRVLRAAEGSEGPIRLFAGVRGAGVEVVDGRIGADVHAGELHDHPRQPHALAATSGSVAPGRYYRTDLPVLSERLGRGRRPGWQ